jgi:hypothetical protein
MSTRLRQGSARDTITPGPKRMVASFDRYEEAEAAVDRLSDSEFPVERTQIVGRGLQLVEQVTGRMTYARAALSGALSGALVGLLIGWLFAVFNWADPLVASGWLILDGLWFGALVGATFGLVQHALTGARRGFASVPGMRAARYDVLADEDVADWAARLLGSQESAKRAGETTPANGTSARAGDSPPPALG